MALADARLLIFPFGERQVKGEGAMSRAGKSLWSETARRLFSAGTSAVVFDSTADRVVRSEYTLGADLAFVNEDTRGPAS